MLPAVVVTIPIFIMYREIGLHDTHLGLILLYTVFNLSLTVWLLKGFLDEIPREYEEAAMVDGYTRLQALRKVVLPQAVTGIAATAVFALIFAWNEYAFALMLTTETRPHRAALHPDHPGPRRHRVVGHRRRHAGLPDSGRDRHLCPAQVPAARRDLWRDPAVISSHLPGSVSFRNRYDSHSTRLHG